MVDIKYPKLRAYLQREYERTTGRGKDCLSIVAAQAKVPESELRDIVECDKPISDEIAEAIDRRVSLVEVGSAGLTFKHKPGFTNLFEPEKFVAFGESVSITSKWLDLENEGCDPYNHFGRQFFPTDADAAGFRLIEQKTMGLAKKIRHKIFKWHIHR